ncbi:hypothetical protein ACFYXH_22620 [Streptomyces sp. NPDC002730]|uniref:hypothetical protein n=1 Tax=Streptomyces sp. NPDC002730 TaxID=3364662 RepID=UPI0036B8D605
MDVVWLVPVLFLAVGVGLGWWLYRYPGGRKPAFSGEYRLNRQDLDNARHTVRSLRSKALHELNEAQTRVTQADRVYQGRIDDLERALQRLREPVGRRELKMPLGEVSLYEHVLVFLGKDVPLANLAVHQETGTTHHYLYVTSPEG